MANGNPVQPPGKLAIHPKQVEPIQRVFVGPLVDGLPPAPAKKPVKVAENAPPLETAEPELQVQAQVDADRRRGDEDLLR